MAEKLIISISGMRGIIGENLTAAIAAEYGCAFGTFLKENRTGSPQSTGCLPTAPLGVPFGRMAKPITADALRQ